VEREGQLISLMALLVRGHYKHTPESIAAHSSPIMGEVADTPFFSVVDSVTLLDRI
jgi:hypothetical protein